MQMDCPVEENLIRKKLGNMAAVKSLEFNLMQRVLTVVHEPESLESVLEAIRYLGFSPELPDNSEKLTAAKEQAKSWWPLALSGLFALLSEISSWMDFPEWSAALLGILAVALSGVSTYKKGWIAVRNGNMNINALMSIAVTGALSIGQRHDIGLVHNHQPVHAARQQGFAGGARHPARGGGGDALDGDGGVAVALFFANIQIFGVFPHDQHIHILARAGNRQGAGWAQIGVGVQLAAQGDNRRAIALHLARRRADRAKQHRAAFTRARQGGVRQGLAGAHKTFPTGIRLL
jgi:copper chaperone CopZ